MQENKILWLRINGDYKGEKHAWNIISKKNIRHRNKGAMFHIIKRSWKMLEVDLKMN